MLLFLERISKIRFWSHISYNFISLPIGQQQQDPKFIYHSCDAVHTKLEGSNMFFKLGIIFSFNDYQRVCVPI
jgi:hypothetical protein